MDADRINPRAPEILVHDWQAEPDIDVERLAAFLERTFGAQVSVLGTNTGAVRAGAGGPTESCRVTDIKRPFWNPRPDGEAPAGVPLYDGHEILRAASSVIGPAASLYGALHMVVTDMLIGTYDEGDARYHARPVVASNPSVLSSSSMVWGPARSRRYYADVMACTQARGVEDEVEARHAADHLTRGDPRMAQVAEGYAMQAVFYAITREAFCADPDCRIYDSHWQSEVLDLNSGSKLCGAHRAALDGLT